MEWLVGCQVIFLSDVVFRFQDLFPPPHSRANIKVSLCTAAYPRYAARDVFFPSLLFFFLPLHLPLLHPLTAFVCNEKYPWKLLCCGRQKKKKKQKAKSKSHGSSTRAVDDIIATAELLPFTELLPDRARPAARSEGLRPRYHRHRGRLK